MINFKKFVFCLSVFVVVEAQHCAPGIVPNLTISSDNQIQWSSVLNPNNCVINAYIINIFDLEDGTEFQYQTGPTIRTYSLASLDMCKSYDLEVHALTNLDVIGPSDRINATIPPSTTMNLTLSTSNVTVAENQLFLTWNLSNTASVRCVSYYRVVYWDEDNDPVDTYVPTSDFALNQTLVPCMEYTFQINAIVENPDIEGPVFEVNFDRYTAVPDIPKIVSLDTTNTTVNMTWSVPTYTEDRCNLTSLVVSTVGLSTNRVAIQDSPLRPNIVVYLANLSPNHVYTSYVYLVNVAGYSKNITATFQTLDSFVFDYERDVTYEI